MSKAWAVARATGLALGAAGSAGAQYAGGEVADGGVLAGTVTWAGDAPAPKKKVMTKKFDKPEIFKITCDARPWMLGWSVVSDHPYVAVTDEKGNFKLDGVPAGTYKVEIVHLDTGTKEVKVSAKEEAGLVVELRK